MVDPIVSSTLAGLAVRSIGDGSRSVGRMWTDRRNRVSAHQLKQLERDAQQFLIPTMAALQDQLGPEEMARVGRFLRSPEGANFARGVAVTVLTRQYPHFEAELRRELAATLALLAGLKRSSCEIAAESLLKTIHKTHERASRLLQQTAPRLHGEAVDRAMEERNAGLLRGISIRATELARNAPSDFALLAEFVRGYRTVLHEKMSLRYRRISTHRSAYILTRCTSHRLFSCKALKTLVGMD